MEQQKNKHGGKREGAGAPLKYGEELEAIITWCPVSRKQELKTLIKSKLKTWEVTRETANKEN